jgi:hypothetical protein
VSKPIPNPKPVSQPVAKKPSENVALSKKTGTGGGGGKPAPKPEPPKPPKLEAPKPEARKSPMTQEEKAIAYENIKSQLDRQFGPKKKIEGEWRWVNEKGNSINIDKLHYDHYHVFDKRNVHKIVDEVNIDWRKK